MLELVWHCMFSHYSKPQQEIYCHKAGERWTIKSTVDTLTVPTKKLRHDEYVTLMLGLPSQSLRLPASM